MNLIKSLSDISRTNQLQITDPQEKVAEKLFQYLFRLGKGIESFNISNLDLSPYPQSLDFYQKQNRAIRQEIQKKVLDYGIEWKYSDIQGTLLYSDGIKYAYFVSPNKSHSGWKQIFIKDVNRTARQRLFNLIFKLYIISHELEIETYTGFEELMLINSKGLSKSGKALFVWGHHINVNYNDFGVLTLTLKRKFRKFLLEDQYSSLGRDNIGEVMVYDSKNYYFDRDLDARTKNQIFFMQFETGEKSLEKFKQTQVYLYQNLMVKLEAFLQECGIEYRVLPFQADHYIKNPFIKNLEGLESLEIINNTGADFTDTDKGFLKNILKYHGIAHLSFYRSGQTISVYSDIPNEDEARTSWKIDQIIPWSEITLDNQKNYLVFNKTLNEEMGSMAYQEKDGSWTPSDRLDKHSQIDFYSRLKKDLSFVEGGVFVCTQGINVSEFTPLKSTASRSWSALNYDAKKIDLDKLRKNTRGFTSGRLLNLEDTLLHYLANEDNVDALEKFYGENRVTISSEFRKALIELGIKNWIKQALRDSNVSLAISPLESCSEKTFFAIYVRRAKYQDPKAVAVQFLYKEGQIYLQTVLRQVNEIESRFPILRKAKNNPDQLVDDQQYYVDETEGIFISCYTNDFFTPTLIGNPKIIDDLKNDVLEVNRRKDNNLLPLTMKYSDEIQPIKDLICLDLKNETYIQYYVPRVQSLRKAVKTGFRVYHMIGSAYSREKMAILRKLPTAELINHPLVALHFNTLTQDVLKIHENSQSSLLQKVAKVFIEN